MAAALAMKRMARERVTLEKPNPDYFVSFRDENLLRFEAYIIGPSDSLYEHKFVKVQFEIPQDYPLKPPKCKFIQHTGDRIHPNLYTEGKICLSILGTWQGEPWALAMTCETVLITIRSLLDNSPYRHEPGQRDNPQFNQYVAYTTWRCLLLDYLAREADPTLKAKLEEHVRQHGDEMAGELVKQQNTNTGRRTQPLTSPYSRGRGINTTTNYEELLNDLKTMVDKCRASGSGAIGIAVDSESASTRTTTVPMHEPLDMTRGHQNNTIPTNYTHNSAPPLDFGNVSTPDSITPMTAFSPTKPNARFHPSHADPAESPAKKPKTVIDLT